LRFTTFLPSRAPSRTAQVLDHVLRRLHDDEAHVVEALAAGAAGDLVEVAGGEVGRLLAVELAEPREQHRADRHVDAGAERVGAADHLQQPELRQLLDQDAVLRQQPGVVQADAVAQPLADVGPYGLLKSKPAMRVGDLRLLLARADLQAREVLRAAGRLRLREVHHVDRRLALVDELLDGVGERHLGVGVLERHRALADFMVTVGRPFSRVSACSKNGCRRAWPTSAGTAPAAA
jgi:hypothetical protein